MKIMAVDYGDAHTGIAISDRSEILVGFTTVLNSRKVEVIIEGISQLVKDHGVERIVFGFPKNMDGTESLRADLYREVADRIKRNTSLEVVLWDERRTTVDAHNILLQSGKNAKKRKHIVDAVAASLILEGYMTFHKLHPEC